MRAQPCNTGSCENAVGGAPAALVVVGAYLSPTRVTTTWTLSLPTVPASMACNWTQTGSYTDAGRATSQLDTTTVAAGLSSRTDCTPTATFTTAGAYTFTLLVLNPFTANTTRWRVVAWVPRLTRGPTPASGVGCAQGATCDFLHAWTFLPLPGTQALNPVLVPAPGALSALLSLTLLLQDVDATHGRTTVVPGNQAERPGALEPNASFTGTYVVRTSWAVPQGAKVSPTYSALVGLQLNATAAGAGGAPVITTLLAVAVEGDPFAVGAPFVLQYGPWSNCSVTCGSGVATRNATCVATSSQATVPLSRCAAGVVEVSRGCSLPPCTGVAWVTTPWGACSTPAGCGGTQNRTVTCMSANATVLPRAACAAVPEPVATRVCGGAGLDCRPYAWDAGAWGSCLVRPAAASGNSSSGNASLVLSGGNTTAVAANTSCAGYQGRLLFCRTQGAVVAPGKCRPATLADAVKQCTGPCSTGRLEVRAGPWRACNRPCGGGVTTRTVTCWDSAVGAAGAALPLSACAGLPGSDLRTEVPCNLEPCLSGSWRVTPLGQCHDLAAIVAAPYVGLRALYGGLSHAQVVNASSTLVCGGACEAGCRLLWPWGHWAA